MRGERIGVKRSEWRCGLDIWRGRAAGAAGVGTELPLRARVHAGIGPVAHQKKQGL